MADFYQMLGLPRQATQDEIRLTFHMLARQCHPDLHPHDKTAEQRFVAINEAHSTLSDTRKRKRYDELLSLAVSDPRRREAARRQRDVAQDVDPRLFGQGSRVFQMGAFSDILWSPSGEPA